MSIGDGTEPSKLSFHGDGPKYKKGVQQNQATIKTESDTPLGNAGSVGEAARRPTTEKEPSVFRSKRTHNFKQSGSGGRNMSDHSGRRSHQAKPSNHSLHGDGPKYKKGRDKTRLPSRPSLSLLCVIPEAWVELHDDQRPKRSKALSAQKGPTTSNRVEVAGET